MKSKTIALHCLALASFAWCVPSAEAAPFTYNPRDIVLGFRSSSAVNDLVVDIGPASQYYGSVGTFNVGGFTMSQLNTAFGSINGISFSAFGDVRTSGDSSYPLNTLWVTSPRVDANVQSSPWNRQSQFSQGNTGAKIDGIANGALNYSAGVPADANNTATSVAMPKTWNAVGISYSIGIGAGGNFGGAFQGGAENTSPSDFTTAGGVLRSDFYELKPGSGSGTYLGYFEFQSNGALTFTAVPEPGIWSLLGAGAVLFGAHGLRRKP